MSSTLVIIITGVLVAVACSICGSFLVVRRMAMLADAISHAILPGLVAGYFLAQGPNLIAGTLGASAAGLLTVVLVEALQRTRRVTRESAIGIVFPGLFALGTFLVSRFFSDVHLDADAVLYGSIEFAAQDPLIIGDLLLGPQALWIMGFLVVLNLAVVLALYKELKIATFDADQAASLGFSPVIIHYSLMALVSVTAVGGFSAVGAVLVVALFIVPAATARLLTSRLPVMIVLACGIGAASALVGSLAAFALDCSVSGAIVSTAGVFFLLAMLFSPEYGTLPRLMRRSVSPHTT